jgi:hypothetical protein
MIVKMAGVMILKSHISGANGWSKDSFVSVERRLDSSLAVLLLLPTPLRSANARYAPDVPISRSQDRVLGYDGATLRGDNDICTSSSRRVVHLSTIVRTVGGESRNLPVGLIQ